MRRDRRRRDSRCESSRGAEKLGVHTGTIQSEGHEAGGEFFREGRRSAQIGVCVGWETQPTQGFQGHPALIGEIDSASVSRCRTAVEGVTMTAGQLLQQIEGLLGERMFLSVAGGVQPPQRTFRLGCGKPVQHREHRGDTHTGGDQYQCRGRVGEEVRAPGCRDVEKIAGADVAVDVAAGQSVWRNPVHAGGGLAAAAVSPTLPADVAGFST